MTAFIEAIVATAIGAALVWTYHHFVLKWCKEAEKDGLCNFKGQE